MKWRLVRANRKTGQEIVLLIISVLSVVTGSKHEFEKILFFIATIIFFTRRKRNCDKNAHFHDHNILFRYGRRYEALKKEDSYSQGPSDKNLNLEDGHRILP
jgi:hypothetical protein